MTKKQSSYNTFLMDELNMRAANTNVPLYEVVSIYCEEIDTEPSDIIEQFDVGFIERIKVSAMQDNVRLKSQHKKNISININSFFV